MIDHNFFVLQEEKLSRFFSVFRKGDWAKILVSLAFLSVFLLLSLGVFFFSLFTFRFLGKYPEVSQPLITYILAITFILTAILTLISSIITSLGTLFQKEDNALLFSLPLRSGTIFESRLLDVILLSSWPLFLFATPLILGYGQALSLDFASSLLFIGGTFLLVLFTNQVGVIIALLISYFFGNLKNKYLGVLLLIAIPFLAVGLIKFILPAQLLTSPENLSVNQISELVNRQPLMARFLPTTWLVNLVYLWPKDPGGSLRNLCYLFFAYLPFCGLLVSFREKFYFQVVNKTYVGQFLAAPHDLVRKNPRSFPYLLSGRMGVLTEKDWLVVFRSPNQFFQFAFILFWNLVYFLIIAQVAVPKFQQVFPWYLKRLVSLNFLFVNYLIAVFAMRFFFPMISLEGQSSWIVWSAPIRKMKIFWQKFISSFLIIFIWSELATFLSIKILGLSFSRYWPLLVISPSLSLTITAITLGIGAIKPNFWEKNPEKLSTSPGGIIATALSLGYIALVSILVFWQNENLLRPITHLTVWATSSLITTPILILVAQKINKYEV